MGSRVPLDELPTFGDEDTIHVVVESPRGSRVKLKYDRRLGAIVLSRPLPTGLAYPHDWGFVPGTQASDGDPVDAMVLSDVGTAPGVVIPCRPIGVLELEQNGRGGGRERNDRMIVIPHSAHRFATVVDALELPPRVRDEISSFFLHVSAFEGKNAVMLGWKGAAAVYALLSPEHRARETGG